MIDKIGTNLARVCGVCVGVCVYVCVCERERERGMGTDFDFLPLVERETKERKKHTQRLRKIDILRRLSV